MEKHRTKAPVADRIFPSLTLASTSQLLLPRAVLDTRLALRDFLLAAGLKELRKAFEEDRTLLCGPKGKGSQTSAIGTTICGSSSRGVATIANRPRSSAPTMMSGVSLLPMKSAAMRPDKPYGVRGEG